MSAEHRMAAQAELLAEGREPEEVTLLAMVDRAVRQLVNRSVSFELIAQNIDRPDAAKYGTHPDGTARYAPEWYVAQDVATGIHEGLHGVLADLLGCDSTDEHGHHCIGSLLHETNHWDGNGCNWATS